MITEIMRSIKYIREQQFLPLHHARWNTYKSYQEPYLRAGSCIGGESKGKVQG